MRITFGHNRKIIYIILLALVIRLAIAPFSYHPWEYRTYNNTCANIHDGINPYSEFWRLTAEVRQHDDWEIEYYEYWAYSPAGLLWLAVLSPLDPEPIDPFAPMTEQVPDPLLSLLFKIPAILADFACAWFIYLLARQTGHAEPFRLAKWYLLMPLPWFLSAVWGGFDSVVLAALLAAIYLVRRPVWSGLALGAGIAVKTIPVFAGPVFMRHTPLKQWPMMAAGVVLVMGGACAYYLIDDAGDLLGAMVGFHGGRAGGGLTIYSVWQLGTMNDFWRFVFDYVWLFPLAGLWAWVWLKHSGDIIMGCALTMFVFVIASKLVNPAYMLYVFPFMLLYTPMRYAFAQLMVWQLIILAWIGINIGLPIFFAWPFHQLGAGVPTVPIEKAYMVYLGLGWLMWALNVAIFRDMLKYPRLDKK